MTAALPGLLEVILLTGRRAAVEVFPDSYGRDGWDYPEQADIAG